MNEKGCVFGGLYTVGLLFVTGNLGKFIQTHPNQIPGLAVIQNASGWLMFISFLCLLIGLVAPKFFAIRLQDQDKVTRKHISYIFGTAFMISFMFAPNTPSDAEKAKLDKSSPQSNQKVKPNVAKAVTAPKPKATATLTRPQQRKFLADAKKRNRDARRKKQAEQERLSAAQEDVTEKKSAAQQVMDTARGICSIEEEDGHLVVECSSDIADYKQLDFARAIADADVILNGERRNIYYYLPSGRQFAQADSLNGVQLK